MQSPKLMSIGSFNGTIIVSEGETLKLVCKATGLPKPTVYWIYGEYEHSESSRKTWLVPVANNDYLFNKKRKTFSHEFIFRVDLWFTRKEMSVKKLFFFYWTWSFPFLNGFFFCFLSGPCKCIFAFGRQQSCLPKREGLESTFWPHPSSLPLPTSLKVSCRKSPVTH
jgi:hypothetical protein